MWMFEPVKVAGPRREDQLMHEAFYQDETECVQHLLHALDFTPALEEQVAARGNQLATVAREFQAGESGLVQFMRYYDLSTQEGILLMCLAEALLRIPDAVTENLLISDKLTSAHWSQHIGESESSLVNSATWGLALSGKILAMGRDSSSFLTRWERLVKRSGEPFIRQAVRHAIKLMSEEFVLGRSIKEALTRCQAMHDSGYVFSFDMLGEAALTAGDAKNYFDAYMAAIEAIGQQVNASLPMHQRLGISVKLSALHPRYEFTQQATCVPELTQSLLALAQRAAYFGMALTVDAEESERLTMSLSIIQAVFEHPSLKDWEGLGLAVQAYQRRAYPLLQWLVQLAKQSGKRLQVRLVKGAYWDTEIKQAQMGGFPDFPVFTRKVSTDVSYLACAKLLLAESAHIYPQFATHNAYSVAAIMVLMENYPPAGPVEFQALQGMGRELHHQIVDPNHYGFPCRIYAPVGSHEDLLPYLVRRLLENGANSSFVNQLADKDVPLSEVLASPVKAITAEAEIPNSRFSAPLNLFGESRQNSPGINLADWQSLTSLAQSTKPWQNQCWELANDLKAAPGHPVINPAQSEQVVGYVSTLDVSAAEACVSRAVTAFPAWRDQTVASRAAILEAVADEFVAHQSELLMLLVREAGKTWDDAISEWREAVDFCRYYAEQARRCLVPTVMPGYTGESNTLQLMGRGAMVCISPWNFPLAIFTGQVAAALVTGNTVLAKPAEQTPLIASRVVACFHAAGCPSAVLQLVIGKGSVVGAALVDDERTAGVVFTGSTATAKHIQRCLAARDGAIVPMIAETGGLNVMITDTSALMEQVVRDVMISAFGSAGQRCSALRLLCVQEEQADEVLKMLIGALQQAVVGDPCSLATDIGPVIDQVSLTRFRRYADEMQAAGKLLYRAPLPPSCDPGFFCPPMIFSLDHVNELTQEWFGPLLHVVRYQAKELDALVAAINANGYGLTAGIHSRIESKVRRLSSQLHAGNIYVNRNMIGAVVGVQPFGGRGLSGTGPKAGGPHYLLRLCEEQTITIDTTAAGGNASLLVLD